MLKKRITSMPRFCSENGAPETGIENSQLRMHGPSFGDKMEQALCSFAFHVRSVRSWANAGQGPQSATASPTTQQWPQESPQIYRDHATMQAL